MAIRYDAESRTEFDRFAYWHVVICRLSPRAAASRHDQQPFAARLEQRSLGVVGVSNIHCIAIQYSRTRSDQRLDDEEEFLVSLMLEGEARIEQGVRSTIRQPSRTGAWSSPISTTCACCR